jgi:hypothetical protein
MAFSRCENNWGWVALAVTRQGSHGPGRACINASGSSADSFATPARVPRDYPSGLRGQVLEAFTRVTHPKALTRLGWLAEITLLLERKGGFPGGVLGADDLTEFLTKVDRPHEPDDLGQPGAAAPDHRAWKYWRITYAVELSAFSERAERPWLLREARGDA